MPVLRRPCATARAAASLVAATCAGCSVATDSGSGQMQPDTQGASAAAGGADSVAAGLGDPTAEPSSPAALAQGASPAGSATSSVPAAPAAGGATWTPASAASGTSAYPAAAVTTPPGTRASVSHGVTYWTPTGPAPTQGVTATAGGVTVTGVAATTGPALATAEASHPVLVGQESGAHAQGAFNVWRGGRGLALLGPAHAGCRLLGTGRAGATDHWASEQIIATLPQVIGRSDANAMTWQASFTGVMWVGTVGLYKC